MMSVQKIAIAASVLFVLSGSQAQAVWEEYRGKCVGVVQKRHYRPDVESFWRLQNDFTADKDWVCVAPLDDLVLNLILKVCPAGKRCEIAGTIRVTGMPGWWKIFSVRKLSTRAKVASKMAFVDRGGW